MSEKDQARKPQHNNKKEVVNVTTVQEIKANKVAEKEMTASVFAGMIGANAGTKFWVSKKFKDTEMKKAGEWSKIFIKEGAIHKTPEILK